MKKGVMPVLMVAYILSMRDNIEIRKNKVPQLDLTKIYEEFNKAGTNGYSIWIDRAPCRISLRKKGSCGSK